MKKISFCFVAVLLCFAMSCSLSKDTEQDISCVCAPRRSTTLKGSKNVSLNDVYAYLSTKGMTKSADSEISIITNDMGDTLLYAIQYPDGWEIVSSDKRVPAIVAFSEVGALDLSSSSAFLNWLEDTKKSMSAIRHSPDSSLSFTTEEISENRMFWDDLNSEGGEFDPDSLGLIVLPFIRGGHWEVQSVTYGRETYDKVDHLMDTQWHQGYPYNIRCPMDDNGNRYALGCGAVAVGQLYYYLRQRDFPDSFLYDNVPLSALKTEMSSNSYDPSVSAVADYLYNIYSELGMHAWDAGTWIMPGDIEDFFENHSYSCEYDRYNADSIRSSLEDGTPAIILAFTPYDIGIGSVAELSDSHYFVIDGYWRLWNVKTTTYRFVRDDPTKPIPGYFDEIQTDVEYMNVMNLYTKMNWGWSSQWSGGHENDGWYSYTDEWVTTENGVEDTYNMYRHMFIIE